MKLFNCVNDIKHFLQNERLIPEKLFDLESFLGTIFSLSKKFQILFCCSKENFSIIFG